VSGRSSARRCRLARRLARSRSIEAEHQLNGLARRARGTTSARAFACAASSPCERLRHLDRPDADLELVGDLISDGVIALWAPLLLLFAF
jgi:hypothetical protein